MHRKAYRLDFMVKLQVKEQGTRYLLIDLQIGETTQNKSLYVGDCYMANACKSHRVWLSAYG